MIHFNLKILIFLTFIKIIRYKFFTSDLKYTESIEK